MDESVLPWRDDGPYRISGYLHILCLYMCRGIVHCTASLDLCLSQRVARMKCGLEVGPETPTVCELVIFLTEIGFRRSACRGRYLGMCLDAPSSPGVQIPAGLPGDDLPHEFQPQVVSLHAL
jgi:hypothetical protein